MHEQSETIQLPDGRWINVYGRGTARAGQPLSDPFQTMEEAISAARVRSATTLTDENTAHEIGLKMNPLYQDQLFSGTATTTAPTGTASAPISSPPVQRRNLRRQAVAGMGSSDRIGSGLQEVGAALQGKSSPLDQRIAAEQQDRLLGLQELKVHTEALQDGVKLATKLKGNTRKQFVTQYAEQLEGMRPGLGAVYQTLAENPDAGSLGKYAERSPTLQRAFEVGGEDAVIKLLSSPEAIKTINAEIDSSVLPTLHKKGQTILMGWQQLVPPQMASRINADERVTASEFLAVNEWIKENKPEFAAATFSDEDLQILSRNEAAFYGALGILPPSEEVDVTKEGVKKGADVGITKQADEYAKQKLGFKTEVSRETIKKGDVTTEATVVDPEKYLSIEIDPEYHRIRAEFFRTKGRDDLADAALKQADTLQTTDKGRAAQAKMIKATMIRDGFPEEQAKQTAENIASGRWVRDTDPQTGVTRIIDLASKRLVFEVGTQTTQIPPGSTATPRDIKPSEATGPVAVLKNVGNVVADFFGQDIPFTDTAKAANAMDNLRLNTLSVMQEAGSWRPSVFTSKLLDEVTQKPLQFFKGDRLSRERMESTRRMILQEVETIDRAVASKALRPEAVSDYTKKRGQLAQLAKEYEVVVNAFDKKFKKAKPEDFWVR